MLTLPPVEPGRGFLTQGWHAPIKKENMKERTHAMFLPRSYRAPTPPLTAIWPLAFFFLLSPRDLATVTTEETMAKPETSATAPAARHDGLY
jgi:hypothetical protein